MTNISCGVLVFLLGEGIWHYQNVKILSWLAQNVRKEIMLQAKIHQQILKELRLQNFVQDAEKELFIKKQNNWRFYV